MIQLIIQSERYIDQESPELITNGDFSDGSTGWTLGTGWSVVGEEALIDGSQTAFSDIRQNSVTEIGKEYVAEFDLNLTDGLLDFKGSGKYGNTLTSSDNGRVSIPFTADHTYIRFTAYPDANLSIGSVDNVSVREVLPAVKTMVGQNVDLYGDETIDITVTLRQFRNISKSRSSYTNTFQVPATDNNNEIFRYYFLPERVVDLESDFRLRANATIEIDFVPFKQGYVLLDEGIFELEQVKSYSVTFISWDVAVFNYLQNVNLKELNWTPYDYDNNDPDIVRDGMNGVGGIFANDVIFPLVQQEYDINDGADAKFTAASLNGQVYPSSRFRPAMKLLVFMDKIEEYLQAIDPAFNIVTHSLNTPEIQSIYVYLPYKYVEQPGESVNDGEYLLLSNWTPELGYAQDIVPFGEIFYIQRAKDEDGIRSVRFSLTINLNVGTEFTLREYVSDDGSNYSLGRSFTNVGGGIYDFDYPEPDSAITAKYLLFSKDSPFETDGFYNVWGDPNRNNPIYAIAMGNGVIQDVDNIDQNYQFSIKIPNMIVSDFMTSMMRLFNMVVWSEDGLTINMETYDYWKTYNEADGTGQVHVLDDYIDIKSATRSTLKMPNTYAFRYEESAALVNYGFNQLNAYYYGDNIVYTGGPGESVDDQVGFSSPLWEQIDTTSKYMVFSCYSENFSSITDKIYLMHWAGEATCDIHLSDWTSAITSYKVCNTFYPLDDPITHSLAFKEEVNPYSQNSVDISLYSLYYDNYYGVLLDKAARKFTYDAYLSKELLNKIDPSDNIQIGDRLFIIDLYKTNLNNGKTSFTLINTQGDETTVNPPGDNTPPNIGVLSVDIPVDTTAPSIPQNLAYSNLGSQQVDLSWSPSTDDISGVLFYSIYYSTVGSPYTWVFGRNVSATNTQVTFQGLTQDTFYATAVTATDVAGNESDKSNVEEFTTVPLAAPVMTSTGTYIWKTDAGGVAKELFLSATNNPNYFEEDAVEMPGFLSIDNLTGRVYGTVYDYDAGEYIIPFRASNDNAVTFGAYDTLTIIIQPL